MKTKRTKRATDRQTDFVLLQGSLSRNLSFSPSIHTRLMELKQNMLLWLVDLISKNIWFQSLILFNKKISVFSWSLLSISTFHLVSLSLCLCVSLYLCLTVTTSTCSTHTHTWNIRLHQQSETHLQTLLVPTPSHTHTHTQTLISEKTFSLISENKFRCGCCIFWKEKSQHCACIRVRVFLLFHVCLCLVCKRVFVSWNLYTPSPPSLTHSLSPSRPQSLYPFDMTCIRLCVCMGQAMYDTN